MSESQPLSTWTATARKGIAGVAEAAQNIDKGVAIKGASALAGAAMGGPAGSAVAAIAEASLKAKQTVDTNYEKFQTTLIRADNTITLCRWYALPVMISCFSSLSSLAIAKDLLGLGPRGFGRCSVTFVGTALPLGLYFSYLNRLEASELRGDYSKPIR